MKQILLVDDSQTILLSMEHVLTRAGYHVETKLNAEAALEYLGAGGKPNLIITDLNMPGMSGIDLIRSARRTPATRFTPILMLTTESAQDRRQEAKAAGATGWLVKPVPVDMLLAAVKQVVPGA